MAIQDGQGGNGHLILQWSDDFGRTWSNERTAEMGKVGESIKRAVNSTGGHGA